MFKVTVYHRSLAKNNHIISGSRAKTNHVISASDEVEARSIVENYFSLIEESIRYIEIEEEVVE